MSNGRPWKLAIIAVVTIGAGVKLLFTDWSLDELSVFVAMVFVAVGALHIVAMSFVGLPGALSALGGGGELAVGATVLAWPAPTLSVLGVLAGSWLIVGGVADATVVLATRADRPGWLLRLLGALVQVTLGVALLLWGDGTARGVGVLLGSAAVLAGLLEIWAAAARQPRGRSMRAPASARSIALVS
jgi:hypothetical protein